VFAWEAQMVQGTANFVGETVANSRPDSKRVSGTHHNGTLASIPMVCESKFSQIKEAITASDLKMLLDIVQEMLARELEVLDNAVASRDVLVAKNALHKLKGLCGNYGLMALADEAKDLESILKNDEDDIEDMDLNTFSIYIARSIGELKLVQSTL